MAGRGSIPKAATLAMLLLGLVAPDALGAQATTASGLTQTVTVTQSSAEAGQPTAASVQTGLASADGTRPSATTQISIALPAGMTANPAAFATCDFAALEEHGPPGCPDASRIGTGTVVGDSRPVIPDPINAIVTILNAPGSGVFLDYFPDLGPIRVAQGQFVGSTLVLDIPPLLTVPSAPDAAIRRLRLDFATPYLVNPPNCPAGGWTWGFAFTYASGEQLTVPVTVPCAAPPPPPVQKNRPAACKALRDALGETAFAARFGTNGSGRNAFGKCVASKGPLA
jgi:hypothetical protein